jgi:hypothetical protein
MLESRNLAIFFGNLMNLDFFFKNPLLMLMYPFFPHKMAKIRYQKKTSANAHYGVEIK